MSLYDKTYLSYGAGVQSTALLILSATGKLGVPRLDFAVFADTQIELPHTYEMLDYASIYLADRGIPMHVDTIGNLEKDALAVVATKTDRAKYPFSRKVLTPMYTSQKTVVLVNGHPVISSSGEPMYKTYKGMNMRACTANYKVDVVYRRLRKELGPRWRSKRGLGMVGISTDEAHRMKPSRKKYNVSAWPLIDAGLSRDDCMKIVTDHGFPTPKRSACYWCPFHSDKEWADLRDNYPEYWQKAIAFEREMDATTKQLNAVRGDGNALGDSYLHPSRKPLNEVDLKPDDPKQIDLFGNECEGMCGV